MEKHKMQKQIEDEVNEANLSRSPTSLWLPGARAVSSCPSSLSPAIPRRRPPRAREPRSYSYSVIVSPPPPPLLSEKIAPLSSLRQHHRQWRCGSAPHARVPPDIWVTSLMEKRMEVWIWGWWGTLWLVLWGGRGREGGGEEVHDVSQFCSRDKIRGRRATGWEFWFLD